MLNSLVTAWCRWLGGTPCFRIYGKARDEADWRVIDLFAVRRRNLASRWPLWAGTCTTWSDRVIAAGWDFAEQVMTEQAREPASRQHPVEVRGGRIGDPQHRADAGVPRFPTAAEILAHECGHTAQALRLGALYLPVVGSVTLLREGPHFWNHFENQASEQGLFGGIVNDTVCTELVEQLKIA